MTMNPSPRFRHAAGLATVLLVAGALAVGANTIQVPTGGSGGQCAAANPNAARFSQSCGAQVTINAGDATASYVQDSSPAAEATYRVRFYVNLRSLQMQNGERFDVFAAYNGADPTPPATSGNPVVRLEIDQVSGVKNLVAFARTDSGSELQSSSFALANGWRSIEINWAKATSAGANNGQLELWIDGTKQTGLASLDNDTLTINYDRWGAVAGLDAGTSGTFRLDDFASQRTGYIGPAFPFGDNPTTSTFFPFIQGIYAAEVIPECAIGSFCPNGAITRKEMAKFLLTAKLGASFTPPACTTPMFSDVPCSHPYAIWINEIAREGITSGCAAGLFCPDGTINRAQMSVFLMVAAGANPAACPPSAFSDVASTSPFCKWIKEIANRGITAGCGGGNFCPESLVLRGQMSVFLTTTFGLPTHVVGGP